MQNIRPYLLLTILCLLLYLPGLAKIPLVDRDEPHFAQSSRQMVETSDYWQIYFQDQPRHLKPPGIYWLQAASVNLFSSSQSTAAWPYRLPSVLGALLAVLLTFAFANRFTSQKTAALSAVLLACSLLLMIEARLAVTDALLLATMVGMQLALGQIYCYSRQQQVIHWIWPLGFWLMMAAGVLVKGITPLVAGLTILGLLALDRRVAWLKHIKAGWGITLLILLSLCWLIPFSIHSGQNFLWDMIGKDLLPKLFGNQQSHGMPMGYFSLILTAAFWPGSLFIILAGIWSWQHRHQPFVRFLLAWILSNWIFFELVHTKLPEYVLPVYPAITILIAMTLAETPSPTNKWLWALIIIQQILWVICSLALIAGFIYLGGWGWLSACIILLASGFLIYLFYHPSLYRYTAAGIAIAVSAFVPLWETILPNLSDFWLSPKVASLINTTAPKDSINATKPLLVTAYQEPSLIFLLGGKRVVTTTLASAIDRAKQQGNLLLVSEQQMNRLKDLCQEQHCFLKSYGNTSGIQYNNRGKPINLFLVQMIGEPH